MFLKDLPRLLEQEINFVIEVELGTKPISILSYRMNLTDLKELITNLQSLQDFVLIQPSVSPSEAPTLFATKKDGTL